MENFLYIVLGLFVGLNLLVVVHELGHFLAARLMGVEVEAFAVGWGKVLLRKKIGLTEFRLCLFPLGGYCKMKGDKYLIKAIEEGALEGHSVLAEPEQGSFHAAAPWQRIVILVAGPVFNLVLTFLLFFLLQAVGVPQHSVDPRIIVLTSADTAGIPTPAQEAGLKNGDWIDRIDGRKVRNFSEVIEGIAAAGESRVELQVLRDGAVLTIGLTPRWIAREKRALIGIASWQEPVIRDVPASSSGAITGLRPGDRITALGTMPVQTVYDLYQMLRSHTTRTEITVERSGSKVVLEWVPVVQAGNPDLLGISFVDQTYPAVGKPLLEAAGEGLRTTVVAIQQTTAALANLFTGRTNATESLSGPLQMSYFVGQSFAQVFQEDTWLGLSRFLTLLANISLALFYMNLLPIPALDGGSILLSLVELIRGKPTSIRFVLRYQQVGGVLIILLIGFVFIFVEPSFFAKQIFGLK